MSHQYTYENELQINMDLKCAICLDPFQSPLCDVRCGHIFCYRCLKKWLHQKQSCPICRQLFTQFAPAAGERFLRELDGLLVRCIHCNARNIERGKFDEHTTLPSTPTAAGDLPDQEKCSQLTHLLVKMKEPKEYHQRQRYSDDRSVFHSLPLWVIIMSSTHLLIYLLLLTPIALLMFVTDTICCPILRGFIWLIRLIRSRL